MRKNLTQCSVLLCIVSRKFIALIVYLSRHLCRAYTSYFEDRAQCIRGYTLNWVSLLALALLDIMLVQYYVTRASMRKVRLE